MRVLAAAVAVFALLATPAAARADSLAIEPPPEGVIGAGSSIKVNVSITGKPRDLLVIRRPAEGPPCAASPAEDYAVAGGERNRESRKTVGTQRSAPSGEYFPQTSWTDAGIGPGTWRLCGWLYSASSGPTEEVSASVQAQIPVRAPKATIQIAQARQLRTFIAFGKLSTAYEVRISGTREADSFTAGIWRLDGDCPNGADDVVRNESPIKFADGPRVGDFERAGLTDGPDMVLGRRYALCAYVFSPYIDEPIAVARKVVNPQTRPLFESPPAVVSKGLPTRRLSCSKGFPGAFPRNIKYSYRWFRDGRRLGARRSVIPVGSRDDGHRYACEVSARNSIGVTRKRSRALRIAS